MTIALSKFEPENPDEHFTIRIQSPWSDDQSCKYMFPEWAFVAMSEFCLLGYLGPRCTHLQPWVFPELGFDRDGATASYSLEYENFWSNGEWTEYAKPILEQIDPAFIACKSATADRFVATCWPRARTVLSNSGLACLHADPTVPNVPSSAHRAQK